MQKNIPKGSSEAHEKLVREILLEVHRLNLGRFWKSHNGLAVSLDLERMIKFGVAGQADITGILKNGVRCEIEVKTGKSQPKKNQRVFKKMIEDHGGVYIVARSVKCVLDKLAIKKMGQCLKAVDPFS